MSAARKSASQSSVAFLRVGVDGEGDPAVTGLNRLVVGAQQPNVASCTNGRVKTLLCEVLLEYERRHGFEQGHFNTCAHRGMQFCRERHGNRKEFVCPYHQWTYALKGDLQGVPFRRGVKQEGRVNGGMPADFQTSDNGLVNLKVAVRGGVVFASFDHSMESLEEFLGPDILAYFDRLFDGRKLKILGYNRQRIPGNWKLMQENIKDPYHPGLLHTWFVTFGLWRADNKSELKMDARHRHAAMISTRGQSGQADGVTQVSSFKEGMKLHDPRFLDIVPEAWWNGPTAVMTAK